MNTTTTEALLGSVLDFIEHSPPDEFLAFLSDSGRDLRALSEAASIGIALSIKTFGAQKRAAAKSQHADAVAGYAQRRAALPSTLSEKMALLARLISDSAASGLRTSLAHRDLSSVPEDELDSLLLQLIDLTKRR